MSVQGAVLNVVRDVRAALGLSMLFISHNVAVVRYISDIVAVMYLGQIVEVGTTDEVLTAPRHPFTKILLDSVPGAAVDGRRTSPIAGEPPDPVAPPSGCRFHPRCPVGPQVLPERTICTTADPCADAAASGEPGGVPLRRRARPDIPRRRVSHALGLLTDLWVQSSRGRPRRLRKQVVVGWSNTDRDF